MSIESTLRDEIVAEMEELKKIEVGTDKYKAAVNGIATLIDKAIDMEKLDIDEQDKVETREFENKFRVKQERRELFFKFMHVCVDILGIAVPTALAIWGTKKTFEFEQEGTVTTIMGRGFINKLLPRR
jgi:hypothetical protein